MGASEDYTRIYRDHTLAKLCKSWPRYAGGFEAFDESRGPEYPHLKAQAQAWAEAFGPDTTRGWYASGGNGSGKTHLAYATAKRLIERGFFDVHILNICDLLQEIKDSWNEPGFTEGAFFAALVESDLVILDDLGAERAGDWSLGVLFGFVNALSRANKPIVATSNYSLADLETKKDDKGKFSKWGPEGRRVTSRLAQMCDPLGPWPIIDQRLE